MLLTRRSLGGGLVSLVAAPAIVRASSLMPVKAVPDLASPVFVERVRAWSGIVWTEKTPYDPSHLGRFPEDACLWPETDYENIT